jgi:hypothetical protein
MARAKQQVPPLRIAINETNRNAPVGMTDFGVGLVNPVAMLRRYEDRSMHPKKILL